MLSRFVIAFLPSRKCLLIRVQSSSTVNLEPKKVRSVTVSIFHWIIAKAREFQRNICLCSVRKAKAFDCVHHSKLWKALKEMGYQTMSPVS